MPAGHQQQRVVTLLEDQIAERQRHTELVALEYVSVQEVRDLSLGDLGAVLGHGGGHRFDADRPVVLAAPGQAVLADLVCTIRQGAVEALSAPRRQNDASSEAGTPRSA